MYKFRFEDEAIKNYFYTNVYDPNRMSIKECKEKNLPYIDLETGFIVNTAAFQKDAGIHYIQKGSYPKFPFKSKAWMDYWKEEKRKCREGVWLGQIRITGDYYYFLNFHSMKMGNAQKQEIRSMGKFKLHQFNFFHLYEYCRVVGHNLGLIKPRGCGLSECAASLNENIMYNPYVDPVTNTPSFNSSIAYSFDKSYLQGDGKLFDLVYQNVEWITQQGNTMGLFKNFEHTKKIDAMHLIPGVITAGGKGTKIQHGGSFQCEIVKKPDEVRGGRKYLIQIEECLKIDSNVLLFSNQYAKIQDVKVGDLLMGIDNTSRKILSIKTGKSNFYKLTYSYNNSSIYVTEDHRISTQLGDIKLKDLILLNSNFYTGIVWDNGKLYNSNFTIEKTDIVDTYYGLELDGDKQFITNNGIVTHNCGAMPILGSVITKLIPSTIRDDVKTGMILVWGTSNADSRGIEAFKNILLNPRIYDCVSFRNIWKDLDNPEKEHVVRDLPLYVFEYMLGKNQNEVDGVGWFIPYFETIGEAEFYNEDGIVDRVGAWNKILANRTLKLSLSAGTSAEKDVLEDIADHPITMEEAFFVSGTNDFDRAKLAKQYQEITIINKKGYKSELGRFYLEKNNNKAITKIKFEKTNNGNVSIFEHPLMNPEGLPYHNLYCGGYDGIDNGSANSQVGEKGSNIATLIKMRNFGLKGNKYVAMYHERPNDERDGYEQVLALCIYYNLLYSLNIEDTKGNIKSYFKEHHSSHYLMRRPKVALPSASKRNTNLIGTPSGNKDLYIHQKNLVKYYISDYANNLVFAKQVEQLLNYSEEKKGQFDLVASMMMCELADEEMMNKKVIYQEEDNNMMKNDIGVYYDERGIKRYGVIPNKNNNNLLQYKEEIKPLYTDNFGREYHS